MKKRYRRSYRYYFHVSFNYDARIEGWPLLDETVIDRLGDMGRDFTASVRAEFPELDLSVGGSWGPDDTSIGL